MNKNITHWIEGCQKIKANKQATGTLDKAKL